MIPLGLCGAHLGEYYVSFEGQDSHIARFMEKCAKAGVRRFTPAFWIGAFRRPYAWVLCTKSCGYGEIEAGMAMQWTEYGAQSPQ
jgi:hypothetical protein